MRKYLFILCQFIQSVMMWLSKHTYRIGFDKPVCQTQGRLSLTINNKKYEPHKVVLIIVSIITLCYSCNQGSESVGENSFDKKIDSLMALMTLDEKIGQLNLPAAGDITTGLASNTGVVPKIKEGKVGGLFNISGLDKIRAAQKVALEESRLGIPLVFAMDVIHGYKTTFPIPLGFSCSWDMGLIEQSARIAAKEATAEGIAWTFSPMTDLSRDPRWGRIAEGVGEDPYLGYEIAKAMVNGYQGDDLSESNTMMACVKHFALYGASEAGRDYNTVDMSRYRMYNEYFLPYKGAIDAGVGSVMASFNEVDGIPATGNKWLLNDVLREQWGFNGMIVTDYTGINEMIAHGVGDLQQSSIMALNAGVDMDMVGEGFLSTMKKSLDEGKITEEQINTACKRVLRAKYKLGLFDDPYLYMDNERANSEVFTQEHRDVARKVASESLVLLKNESVLPLKKKGTVAVIGPLADNKENMPGTWSVSTDVKSSVSLIEGLRKVAGSEVNFLKAKGANFIEDKNYEDRVSVFGKNTYRDDRSEAELTREALAIAKKADIIIAAMGEASEMSGESSSRTSIDLPPTQQRLLKKLVKTGKPVILVLFTGRPLTLKWEDENVPAILNVWFAGTEAGLAIADVLYGDVNPSGKLTTSFPQNEGQIPVYYNHKNTGRPLPEGEWFQKFRSNYLDVSNEPLYPFGYGLSYTQFEYGAPKVSSTTLVGNQILNVEVEVSNAGDLDGKEVVQLYIRDIVGSVTRPVKELKAFRKIELKAGETKTVSFDITPDHLRFYNYDLEYDWEPGEFEVMVGGNSRDVQSISVTWTKK